jgi:hypothetical protein
MARWTSRGVVVLVALALVAGIVVLKFVEFLAGQN